MVPLSSTLSRMVRRAWIVLLAALTPAYMWAAGLTAPPTTKQITALAVACALAVALQLVDNSRDFAETLRRNIKCDVEQIGHRWAHSQLQKKVKRSHG